MVKSAKGKVFNMQALMIANQKAVALGNAKMNARGDILGKNGKVLKTREQIAQEYNKTPPNKVANVPISKDVIAAVKEKEIKEKAADAEHVKKVKQAKNIDQ